MVLYRRTCMTLYSTAIFFLFTFFSTVGPFEEVVHCTHLHLSGSLLCTTGPRTKKVFPCLRS